MTINKTLSLLVEYGKEICILIGIIGGFLFVLSFFLHKQKTGFKGSKLKSKSIEPKDLFRFSILKRGIFISGASGSGKTQSVINPIISEIISNDYASITYDFKFDNAPSERSLSDVIYSRSITKKSKVKNYYFNLDDPKRSVRLNPLKFIPDSSYASSLAETFLFNISTHNIKHQDFWFKNSRALLGAAIWWFYKEQPKICTLPHVLEFVNNPAPLEKKIELLMKNTESYKIIAPVRSGISSQNQAAGAQSSPQADFSNYCTPNVYWSLSGSEFLLDVNNLDSPRRIILGNNAAKGTFNTPILALLIAASIQNCSHHGRTKTVILLDEASSIFIPQISQNAATLRDYDIATVFCAQDMSQVSILLQGQTQADALLSNLNTHIYGKCNVPRSCELIEKRFSTVKEKSTTRTSNNSGINTSFGKSESIQDRPALSSHQIAHFKEGEFAIHSPKFGEFKTHLNQAEPSFYKLPEFNFILPDSIRNNYNRITQQIDNLFI